MHTQKSFMQKAILVFQCALNNRNDQNFKWYFVKSNQLEHPFKFQPNTTKHTCVMLSV